MTSDEPPAPEDARSGSALPWKRLLVVGLGLTLLIVALVRGSGDPPEAPPEEPTRFEDELLNVPLPPTPHKDRLDEARGMYVLENDRARFSLELMREGANPEMHTRLAEYEAALEGESDG